MTQRTSSSNGVAATFADILPGYEVKIVVDENYGQFHALRVEATSATIANPPLPTVPLPESSESVPPLPETPQPLP